MRHNDTCKYPDIICTTRSKVFRARMCFIQIYITLQLNYDNKISIIKFGEKSIEEEVYKSIRIER